MDMPDAPAGDVVHRIRAEAVDWLDVDEQVIALDSEKSVYVSINQSGAVLWHRLVAGATEDELADQLVATYGIAGEQARNDVLAFLDMLAAQGLLES